MNISIPYDEITLKTAAISASSKLEKEGIQEIILDKISQISPQSMSEFNIKSAEFHGITLSELVNSPNYEILKNEYATHNLSLIRNIYKESGFNDKESWALICLGLGKLND